jgi:hypothetical protein
LRGARWGAHAPLSTEGVRPGTQGALACWASATRRRSAGARCPSACVGAEPSAYGRFNSFALCAEPERLGGDAPKKPHAASNTASTVGLSGNTEPCVCVWIYIYITYTYTYTDIYLCGGGEYRA